MISKNLKEKLKTLPSAPGVYFHKNQQGEVIYVGKAAVLKNRVRQYFQSGRNKSAKILKMINKEYLLILHIKQGKNINMSIKDIASALGKNEYIISKKYWNFVDSLSEEFLIKKLESGCNLEEAVMLGEIEDKTAVELMIAEQV